MCFEPVELCFSNRTILETHGSFPFEFAPVPLAVESDQPLEDAYAPAGGYRLDLPDCAEDLESHDAQDTARRDSDGLTFFH